MKIWGRASSVNVQKVLWALDELAISYERVDAGGKYGVVDMDVFARMNPMRRVPVLEEDGFVLWESHAILRYLGSSPSASQTLVPDDAKARAIMDQWMEFTTSTLQPAFIGVFWQLVRTPEAQRSAETVARTRAEYEAGLAILEKKLSESAFLAGDTFGMADIAAGSLMHRTLDLGLLPSSMRAVKRWAETLAGREGYARHIATSYEELRAL
ncbi:glutathione S-transferase N-terminal domain-containing protein [Aquamicrobium sp. LC103]|uniref:glutathione S-transferase family protein n=1 Tax=Aquamicrobium sp. LC103 TaxID=1120658 RepID=UPI00069B4AB2|nr:glutathione S-transferase N-terminal domain-containing protein [Aquamicrobium sp. LC103]